MEKEIITRKDLPPAHSPYSPAVMCGGLVFISGQVPVDPVTGVIASDDFKQQVEQIFKNLEAILAEAGSSLEKVVKTTVFLIDMDDFPDLNVAYKKHFVEDHPARSCIEVSRLPFDAKVEIEAIAVV